LKLLELFYQVSHLVQHHRAPAPARPGSRLHCCRKCRIELADPPIAPIKTHSNALCFTQFNSHPRAL